VCTSQPQLEKLAPSARTESFVEVLSLSSREARLQVPLAESWCGGASLDVGTSSDHTPVANDL
jgi:hypothetical protein